MDGYEVARAIRCVLGNRVFLIAATGYGLPEDEQRAREAGFDAHLTKPVQLEAMAALLGEAAKRRA
jgi:CheY-like chemotaxis protein